MRFLVFVWLAAGVLILEPMALVAQRVLDWDQFAPCEACQLTLREAIRLGDQRGPGVIESDDIRVIRKAGLGYVLWSELDGQSLALFNEQGVFVRRIGAPGEGPGELSFIEIATFIDGDQLAVLDQSSRLTTFRASGEYVRSVTLQSERSSRAFQLVEGDSVAVLGRFGSRPESVGYPLHSVNTSTGAVTDHFGSSNPASWSAREPQARVVLLGRTDRLVGSAWWSKRAIPHIEHWGLDDTHMLTITGELDWYPKPAGRRPRGSPWGSVSDFSVDSENRLWLVTWVPDPNWQQIQRGGSESGVSLDQAGSYWDSRLDVYDLTRMRHLGSHTWDAPWLKLLHHNGEVSVSLVEYQTPTWPRAFIYGVDIQDPQGRK